VYIVVIEDASTLSTIIFFFLTQGVRVVVFNATFNTL